MSLLLNRGRGARAALLRRRLAVKPRTGLIDAGDRCRLPAALLLWLTAMTFVSALAALATFGRSRLSFGRGRWRAHPGNVLADQLLDGGHRLAVGGRHDRDRGAGAAGAAGAADAVHIVVSM